MTGSGGHPVSYSIGTGGGGGGIPGGGGGGGGVYKTTPPNYGRVFLF